MVVNDQKVTSLYKDNVKKQLSIYQHENRQLKSTFPLLFYEILMILYSLLLLTEEFPFYVIGLYMIPVCISIFFEKYKVYTYNQSEIYNDYYQLSFQIIFWKMCGLAFATFLCPIALIQKFGIAFLDETFFLGLVFVFFIQLLCTLVGALVSYIAEKIHVEKKRSHHSAWLLGIATFLFIIFMIYLSLTWFIILILFADYIIGFMIGDAFYKSRKIREERRI